EGHESAGGRIRRGQRSRGGAPGHDAALPGEQAPAQVLSDRTLVVTPIRREVVRVIDSAVGVYDGPGVLFRHGRPVITQVVARVGRIARRFAGTVAAATPAASSLTA